MSLWSAAEIASAVDGVLQGWGDEDVLGVSIDTRSVKPGDLFVAIKGPNHDAHNFAHKAVEAGATVLLLERPMRTEAVEIIVEDTVEALETLGRVRRNQIDGFVLGITGSVGKTGTKELAAAGFRALGKTHATKGNLNNHFGVPLTLARMPRDTEFAVIEMGMSAPGEIRSLTKLVRPHTALITWVSVAHSAFFKNTEEIALAKAEIFEGLVDGGLAVIPADNDYAELLKDKAQGSRTKTFGTDPKSADTHVAFHGTDGLDWHYDIDGEQVALGLAGRHWGGSAGALLASLPENLDREAFIVGMGRVEPFKGRGKRQVLSLPQGEALIIDESYNASPAAMKAALELLLEIPNDGGRRIAVLGDMLELDKAAEEHAAIGAFIATKDIDLVHASGAFANALLDKLRPEQRGHSSTDPESLYTEIAHSIHAGDIWLVKGSLGSKIHKIVGKLTAQSSSKA